MADEDDRDNHDDDFDDSDFDNFLKDAFSDISLSLEELEELEALERDLENISISASSRHHSEAEAEKLSSSAWGGSDFSDISDSYGDYDNFDNFELLPKPKKAEPADWYTEFMKLYVEDLMSLSADSKARSSLAKTSKSSRIISGSGDGWFYEPSSRSFVRVPRGTEVLLIPGAPDEKGRVLVRTVTSYVLVPEDELIKVKGN